MTTINKETICLLMIDTSTSACSVAVSKGQEIIKSYHIEAEKAQHAATLPPLIDEILKECRTLEIKLNAVVISSGPGSYTGLRIGSSLSKGLAHGLALPLIAVSTLEMMANGYAKNNKISTDANLCLIPMIDARRMEVYSALYNSSVHPISDEEAIILEKEALPYSEMTGKEVHIFGNGAKKCQDLWDNSLSFDRLIIDFDFTPNAIYMLEPALKAYEEGRFADLAYWTPNYLKDYVAKVSKNKVLGI